MMVPLLHQGSVEVDHVSGRDKYSISSATFRHLKGPYLSLWLMTNVDRVTGK